MQMKSKHIKSWSITISHGETQLFSLLINQINIMVPLLCANNYVAYRGSDVRGKMLLYNSMEARRETNSNHSITNRKWNVQNDAQRQTHGQTIKTIHEGHNVTWMGVKGMPKNIFML